MPNNGGSGKRGREPQGKKETANGGGRASGTEAPAAGSPQESRVGGAKANGTAAAARAAAKAAEGTEPELEEQQNGDHPPPAKRANTSGGKGEGRGAGAASPKAGEGRGEDVGDSGSSGDNFDPAEELLPNEVLDVPEHQEGTDRVETLCKYQPSSYKPDISRMEEGAPGTKTGRPMRLYADGIFDLFHYGHAKALEQAKKTFPNSYLLVGCCSDEMTHRYKGQTVMREDQRYESLKHCKWVDAVVEDAPWVVTDEFMERHQIDFVCHDALPYGDSSGNAEDGDVYLHLKRKGRFAETERTEGISTSDIIAMIIQDYDNFVRRNLERGYSAKELNVSKVTEGRIRTAMLKDKLTDKLTSKVERGIDFFKENQLSEMQQGFIKVFDRDGAFRTHLREQRRSFRERMATLATKTFC